MWSRASIGIIRMSTRPRSDIALGQRAIVSQMRDPQASHLDPPDRVFLLELFAPRIRVLPANTGDVKVAHRVGLRVAQHPDFWSPWHRSTDELATIVIEVRVGDQDRVRGELLRKVVTQPDAACIRVDQETVVPGGMDA